MRTHLTLIEGNPDPPPRRRLRVVGPNVTKREARLSEAIRRAVRAWRGHKCHNCERIAWEAVGRWEKETGRTWTGVVPRNGPEAA